MMSRAEAIEIAEQHAATALIELQEARRVLAAVEQPSDRITLTTGPLRGAIAHTETTIRRLRGDYAR